MMDVDKMTLEPFGNFKNYTNSKKINQKHFHFFFKELVSSIYLKPTYVIISFFQNSGSTFFFLIF